MIRLLPILLLSCCASQPAAKQLQPQDERAPNDLAVLGATTLPSMGSPAVASPSPIDFFYLDWDAPDPNDNIITYYLYVWEHAEKVFKGKIPMNWQYHLGLIPTCKVMFNTDKMFMRLSAENEFGESPLSDDTAEYPPPPLP